MLSITLAIGLKGYSRNVDRATRSDHVISSPLINYLSSLREVAPKDYTYHATDELLVLNPVMRCTAAPFVFPAVSERPWMGVFLSNVPCDYKYYGFEMYRSVIYGY